VDLNRNRLAVIEDSDSPIALNSYLNFGHFIIPLIVIRCIDQDLVKYFIEARNIADLVIY